MPFDANLKGPYKTATKLKRDEEAFGGSFIPSKGPWQYDVENGRTWGSLEHSHTGDKLFSNRVLVIKECGRHYYSEETASAYLPVLAFVQGRIFCGYLRTECDGGLSFDGTFEENDGEFLRDSNAFDEAYRNAQEQCRIACDIDTEYAREEREKEEEAEREAEENARTLAVEKLSTITEKELHECLDFSQFHIAKDATVTFSYANGQTFAEVALTTSLRVNIPKKD